MKTTLDLPDDVMRQVKILAAEEGKKLKDLFTEFAVDALKRRTSAPKKVLRIVAPTNGRLPYFDCNPSSDATPTVEELQAIIDQSQLEEDLQRAGISV